MMQWSLSDAYRKLRKGKSLEILLNDAMVSKWCVQEYTGRGGVWSRTVQQSPSAPSSLPCVSWCPGRLPGCPWTQVCPRCTGLGPGCWGGGHGTQLPGTDHSDKHQVYVWQIWHWKTKTLGIDHSVWHQIYIWKIGHQRTWYWPLWIKVKFWITTYLW